MKEDEVQFLMDAVRAQFAQPDQVLPPPPVDPLVNAIIQQDYSPSNQIVAK